MMMEKIIRPAAQRAYVTELVGLHTSGIQKWMMFCDVEVFGFLAGVPLTYSFRVT